MIILESVIYRYIISHYVVWQTFPLIFINKINETEFIHQSVIGTFSHLISDKVIIHQSSWHLYYFSLSLCKWTGSEARWETETGREHRRSRHQCLGLPTEESDQELQPGRPWVWPGHPGKAWPSQGPEKGQGQSQGQGQKVILWFWKFLSWFMNHGSRNCF